jgi:hypothetical protein
MNLNRIVNWELLSNPMNWIIVALMLGIGTFALALVLAPPETSVM